MWNHIRYLTEANIYCVYLTSLGMKCYLTEQVKDYLFFKFFFSRCYFTNHFVFHKVCSKE